jgi:hypothetical protein
MRGILETLCGCRRFLDDESLTSGVETIQVSLKMEVAGPHYSSVRYFREFKFVCVENGLPLYREFKTVKTERVERE